MRTSRNDQIAQSSGNGASRPAHWQSSPAPPEPPPRTFAAVNLTTAEIAEFRAIYERITGMEASEEAAREMATRLMLFVHALVRQDRPANHGGHRV